MRITVSAPSAGVLAGRAVEAVRSTVPDADVRLATDAEPTPDHDATAIVVVADAATPAAAFASPGPVLALALPDATVPDGVPRVPVDPAAPEAGLDALRTWLRAVAAGRDPPEGEGFDAGTAVGAAAAGGLAGLLLGGLLGDDGDPPFGGDLF